MVGGTHSTLKVYLKYRSAYKRNYSQRQVNNVKQGESGTGKTIVPPQKLSVDISLANCKYLPKA